MRALWTIFFVAFTLTAWADDKNCLKTKAAFDIGSGATKLKVARVDTCLQKIKKVLVDTSLAVPYKDSLQNNDENVFDANLRKKGIEAINKLKALARIHAPASYLAVATSAFRTAKNGQAFAGEILGKTGVKVEIIDQDREARIGFAGASANVERKPDQIVVWDIGGGSMQITAYDHTGKFQIYRGKIASASFKKHIIEEIQGANPKAVTSPNPIDEEDHEIAQRDAMVVAMLTVPDEIKQKIKKGASVIGIGGVHSQSIKNQTGAEKVYTLEALDEAIHRGLGKSDEQIGGDYASSDISNLILVRGFMEGMEVEEVLPKNVNLADGLLVQ